VKYLFSNERGPLADASILFAVTNLLNKAPPFVSNEDFAGINFDGANANALGRFLSLQLSKRW
jgi:outer membrane receptor protein involved in Fe transport